MTTKLILIICFSILLKRNASAQKDTVYTYFGENKTILKSIKPYNNRKLEGTSITYYPLKGLEYSITYSNGVKDGFFKHYYKNGKVKRYKVYDNNKLIWQAYYNPKGEIDFEEVFFKGKMLRTMYRNGVPEFN